MADGQYPPSGGGPGGDETDPVAAVALAAHTGNTSNPHAVTKAQVGLGSVDNTADAAKPVSAAMQAVLDLKAAAADLATETTNRQGADSTLTAAAAAAQATADAALPKAGGTMTGDIVLKGDPSASLHPATRQYVLAQIAALINGAPGALDTLKEIADQLASDESAVAALTSAVSGKLAAASNLSDLVNAGTARTNLGLGTAATQASGAFDAAGAAAAAQAASQPLDSDLSAVAALSTTSFGRALLTASDEAWGWAGAQAVGF